MRRRLLVTVVLVPALVLLVALSAGWSASRSSDTRSAVTSALDALPADTAVAGVTDWASIRDDLDLGAASTATARASLTNDSLDRDLSSRSVIGGFVEQMHSAYGWSAADVVWEAYGQAPGGAAMVARLDRTVSMSTVRSGLRRLGYTQDGKIWTAGPGTVTKVGQDLASTLGSVTLLTGQRLVIASDRPAYAAAVRKVAEHAAPSLLTVRSAAGVASTMIGLDSVLLQQGALVCDSTAVKDEGAEAVAQARAAVTRAGALEQPTFSGRGLDDGSDSAQRVRFAWSFASPREAAGQLGPRTTLASGPFIGRSGRVEDALDLTGSSVSGSTVTLRFAHDPDSAVIMTGEGPLLFAGCGT